MGQNQKILVAKVGFDAHDTGTEVFVRCLRDEGYKVIYLGMHRTPDEIVKAAVETKPDMIGMSMYAGGHEEAARELMQLLGEQKISVPVIFGGFIPASDVPALKKLGVSEVYAPGLTMAATIRSIKTLLS